MSPKRTAKRTTMRPPEQEPRWQTVEKVVAVLEKVLEPSAHVEHNVRLPVIGRPRRRPRQCDVVITYGKAPRQTTTIVEVQDRGSKPNLTTFHGWTRKMREVGAQQLICVSERGYPKSIIDDVASVYGPTVHLMTLQDVEELKIPGFIMWNFLAHGNPKFYFELVGSGIKLEPIEAV